MRIRAIFTVFPRRVHFGIHATSNIGYEPLTINVKSALVRIEPIVEKERIEEPDVDADGNEEFGVRYIGPEPFLTHIRVVVERNASKAEVDKDMHRQIQGAASEALRPVMLHLRAVTRDPEIDTNLLTLRLEDYLDEVDNVIPHGNLTPLFLRFPNGW